MVVLFHLGTHSLNGIRSHCLQVEENTNTILVPLKMRRLLPFPKPEDSAVRVLVLFLSNEIKVWLIQDRCGQRVMGIVYLDFKRRAFMVDTRPAALSLRLASVRRKRSRSHRWVVAVRGVTASHLLSLGLLFSLSSGSLGVILILVFGALQLYPAQLVRELFLGFAATATFSGVACFAGRKQG